MILNFDEIKKEDVLIAGGKGANLGEMTSAKINVPRGFVITADDYRDFLKENSIDIFIENEIRKSENDEKALLNAADDFRTKIKSCCAFICNSRRFATCKFCRATGNLFKCTRLR